MSESLDPTYPREQRIQNHRNNNDVPKPLPYWNCSIKQSTKLSFHHLLRSSFSGSAYHPVGGSNPAVCCSLIQRSVFTSLSDTAFRRRVFANLTHPALQTSPCLGLGLPIRAGLEESNTGSWERAVIIKNHYTESAYVRQ